VTPLAKLLEAALFASGRPIPTDELAALDEDASGAAVAAALDELREHYDVEGRGNGGRARVVIERRELLRRDWTAAREERRLKQLR